MAARRSFLAAQVALSLIVLVGALLFVRTIHALRATDLGLRSDHLLALEPDAQPASADAAVLPRGSRARGRPARRSLSNLPLGAAAVERVVADRSDDGRLLSRCALPRRPATSSVPLTSRRWVSRSPPAAISQRHKQDNAPKVAIVSETLAGVYGGGESVLGPPGCLPPISPSSALAPRMKVFARCESQWRRCGPCPQQQPNLKYLNLLVRTTGDPDSLTAAVTAIVAVDPQVALFEDEVDRDANRQSPGRRAHAGGAGDRVSINRRGTGRAGRVPASVLAFIIAGKSASGWPSAPQAGDPRRRDRRRRRGRLRGPAGDRHRGRGPS